MKINYAPISVAVEKVILKHEIEIMREKLAYRYRDSPASGCWIAVMAARQGAALVAQGRSRINHAAQPDYR